MIWRLLTSPRRTYLELKVGWYILLDHIRGAAFDWKEYDEALSHSR